MQRSEGVKYFLHRFKKPKTLLLLSTHWKHDQPNEGQIVSMCPEHQESPILQLPYHPYKRSNLFNKTLLKDKIISVFLAQILSWIVIANNFQKIRNNKWTQGMLGAKGLKSCNWLAQYTALYCTIIFSFTFNDGLFIIFEPKTYQQINLYYNVKVERFN